MEPQTDERQRMGDPRVPQLQARIRELEAALREIAGYEKSSLEVENAFAASLCGKARVALTSQMETGAKDV